MEEVSGELFIEGLIINQLGLTQDEYRSFIFHMGCAIAEKHFPEKNLTASDKYWEMYKKFVLDIEYYVQHRMTDCDIRNSMFKTNKYHFDPDIKEYKNTMLGWLEDDDAPRYIINKFTVENLKKL